MRRKPVLPRMGVGDRISYDGDEFDIVGISQLAGYADALAFRLRANDGTHSIVLVGDVYADMAARSTGAPVEASRLRRLRRSEPFHGDPDALLTRDPHGYLGLPYVPKPVPDGSGDVPEPEEAASARPLWTAPADVEALLEGISPRAREEALSRQGHVLEVLTGYRSGHLSEPGVGEPRPQYDPDLTPEIGLRLKAKADEIGVHERTVARWLAGWRDAGLWGLVNGNNKRAVNPLGRLDPRIIDAILEMARVEEWESTGTPERARRRLQARLDGIYKGDNRCVLPPPTTLRRAFEVILKGRFPFGQAKSRQTRGRSPEHTFQRISAVRPGELVFMDATRLDNLAFDPFTGAVVTLTLTLALDVATRTLCAFRIVPGADNRADAVLLLADMMRPEPMRPHWREELSFRLLGLPKDMLINHDSRFELAAARPVIYPETVVVDQAKVYLSDAFQRGCELLGINPQPARVYNPVDKANVERLFKRIANDFCQHVAGYKGNTTVNRGRLSDAQARWSVAEIEEFFAEYAVTFYPNMPHDGLPVFFDPKTKMTPNQAYAAAVSRCGWVPAPVDDTLYFQLLPIKWVEIHRYGMEVDYRKYDGTILRQYDDGYPSPYVPPVTAKGQRRGRDEGQRRAGQLWPLRIDPRDLLYAYFQAPDLQWYALRWGAAPDELLPFTESYAEYVRKVWMPAHGRDNTSEREIAEALLELQTRMDAPETWSSKDKRQLQREAERAREAARDRALAARPHEPDLYGRSASDDQPSDSESALLDPATIPPLRRAHQAETNRSD